MHELRLLKVRVTKNQGRIPTDASVEAAWAAEIQRRIVELNAGVAKTIPWNVVREGLHQRLCS